MPVIRGRFIRQIYAAGPPPEKASLELTQELMRALALEADPDGPEHDVEVEPQRPVAQVIEVAVDARLHLLDRARLAAQAVHLRAAGEPGAHLVALHVALDQLAVELLVRHRMRARAHQ